MDDQRSVLIIRMKDVLDAFRVKIYSILGFLMVPEFCAKNKIHVEYFKH